MKRLPVVTILIGLLFAMPGCEMARGMLASSDKPTARVVSVDIENLRLDGLDLALGVEVTNPYSVSIPIVGLDFALASKATPFLRGSLGEGGTIAGGGKRVLPVRARVTFAEVLKLLGGVEPGAVVPYSVDATVSVDAPVVGRLSLPVSHEGEFPIPEVPDIEMGKIRFGKLRPDSVEAVLEIDIANGNAFAIDVASLDLGLSLAGRSLLRTSAPKAKSIGAKKKTRLEIPVAFSPIEAGLATYSMLTGSGASYGLEGTLSANTPFGALSMPVSVTGDTVFSK